MLKELASNTKKKIIGSVVDDFPKFIGCYDERKYPPDVLKELREKFSRPEAVTREMIGRALKWKFGKHNQLKLPVTQRRAIENARQNWPRYVMAGAPVGSRGFEWWSAALPKSSFISYSFLIHLRSPDIPIIDQHNFRAVQHYLKSAVYATPARSKPSTWEDILLVRDFTALVLMEWPCSLGKPSADEVDRFLMMRGKCLKKHKKRAASRLSYADL